MAEVAIIAAVALFIFGAYVVVQRSQGRRIRRSSDGSLSFFASDTSDSDGGGGGDGGGDGGGGGGGD